MGSRCHTSLQPRRRNPRNFTPAPDEYYVIEIFPEGADPNGANAVVTQNIGKPPVVNGECESDIHAMIQTLAPGNYFGTVTTFGSDGSARSSPSASFTR